MQNTNLPTLADLQKDPQKAWEEGSLNFIVNQDPPANFVKLHPLVKVKNELGAMVPLPYMPVDKVEFLMTMIFRRWEVKNLKAQALFNSVCVTLTVVYWTPTGEMMTQDGIGAAPIQTDKDSKASDLASIKNAAVQMAAPAAASYAFKDACEKIGRIFGRDLGRKHVLNFEAYEPPAQPEATDTEFTQKAGRTRRPKTEVQQPAQMPDLQPTGAPQLQGYNPQPLPMAQFQQYADTVPHPDPAQQWPNHPANNPNGTWQENDAAAAAYAAQSAAALKQAERQHFQAPNFEPPSIKF